MAEQQDPASKTEEPTSKRLDDAREKGQIPHSQEVNHWFMIGGITLIVAIFSANTASGLTGRLAAFLGAAHEIPIEASAMSGLLANVTNGVLMLLLPALGVLIAAAILGNLVQHPIVMTIERIKPQFSRISPLSGLKRIASWRSIVDFSKSLLKLVIVGFAASYLVWPKLDQIPLIVTADPVSALRQSADLILSLLIGIFSVLAFIAGADLLYQKWEHRKGLRMSKQELKEEAKQSEGDPQVKGRIRQIRLERSRKRMMAAVPSADVVVTNPTHFAVALKYDMTKMGAPKVVAKGQDLIALAVRRLAEENKVPIVENPPLARALYAACDIDAEIPVEHYKAVAEVISFVMRLKGKRPPARRSAPPRH